MSTVAEMAATAAAQAQTEDSGYRLVTYNDGTTELVDIRSPVHTYRAAKMKIEDPILFGYTVAWFAAGQQNGGVESWLDRIRTMDAAAAPEETDGDPTVQDETPPE